MSRYVAYDDAVESLLPGEDAIIAETVALMLATMKTEFDTHRHAASGTHAKSHGVLTGSLQVTDDLEPALAQGMFASPARYDVVLRLASEPGHIDPDTARRARGAALKVLDVPGEKLAEGWPSHDWLFNTWPVIPEGDAQTYLIAIRERQRHAGQHLRTTLGTLARVRDRQALLFERTPNVHPLAHTYYTQSAFRYGDAIAKLRLLPAGASAQTLGHRPVQRSDPPDVLSRWVQAYTRRNPTRFLLQVQLCTDLSAMPVEDASIEWSQHSSPYKTVGVIDFPPQDSFTPARRVYADDVLGGRPWNGLTAHRPLGSINRVRARAYTELGQWRRSMNDVVHAEPTRLADIPD